MIASKKPKPRRNLKIVAARNVHGKTTMSPSPHVLFSRACGLGAVLALPLGLTSSALAAPRDACSLVSVQRVQRVQGIIGSDAKVASDIPEQSRRGETASSCTYVSSAYSAQAQTAIDKLNARSRARGQVSAKGSTVLVAGVTVLGKRLENEALSRKLSDAAFGKL
jgi:hypothetical protein